MLANASRSQKLLDFVLQLSRLIHDVLLTTMKNYYSTMQIRNCVSDRQTKVGGCGTLRTLVFSLGGRQARLWHDKRRMRQRIVLDVCGFGTLFLSLRKSHLGFLEKRFLTFSIARAVDIPSNYIFMPQDNRSKKSEDFFVSNGLRTGGRLICICTSSTLREGYYCHQAGRIQLWFTPVTALHTPS